MSQNPACRGLQSRAPIRPHLSVKSKTVLASNRASVMVGAIPTAASARFTRSRSKKVKKKSPSCRPTGRRTAQVLKGIHMTKEEKKADFLRRFRASRERKEEYLSKIEMRMREDYRIRTGKEAESFNVL